MTGRARKPILPGAAGYRMPAEWEPHESTWLAWPHFRDDWPGKFEPIQWVYAEIVRNLARHERVDLIVNGAEQERRARVVLEKADALSERVQFHLWRTDRVWTRDSGCIFLKRTTEAGSADLLALNFEFNAWAKYPNYKYDAKLGARMAKTAGARVVQPFSGDHRVVLEGGSIDVNGCGTLLTTEECLLSTTQQRNPPMDSMAYEQMFADYFGVQSVIWLGDGIAGDDRRDGVPGGGHAHRFGPTAVGIQPAALPGPGARNCALAGRDRLPQLDPGEGRAGGHASSSHPAE